MVNKSKHTFTDISSEAWREYVFENGKVYIERPTHLSVSSSGGHRILDALGISHYIPTGWLHLRWQAFGGEANFVA